MSRVNEVEAAAKETLAPKFVPVKFEVCAKDAKLAVMATKPSRVFFHMISNVKTIIISQI